MSDLRDILEEIGNTEYASILPDNDSKRQSIALSSLELNGTDDVLWLIEGIIPANSVTLLAGEGGSGKTHFAAKLASCITNGVSFYGKQVIEGNVLYVSLEDDTEVIGKILEQSNVNLQNVSVLRMVQTEDTSTQVSSVESLFTLPENFKVLYDEISNKHVKPVLVIIDTIARATGDKSSAVQEQVARGLSQLATETGVSILVIAHPLMWNYSRKRQIEERLGKYMPFYTTARMVFYSVSDDTTGLKGIINRKNNNGALLPPMLFTMYKTIDGRLIMERIDITSNSTKRVTVADKVLAYLDTFGPTNAIVLSSVLKEKPNTVRQTLRRLLYENKIFLVSYGTYDIKNSVLEEQSEISEKETKDTETEIESTREEKPVIETEGKNTLDETQTTEQESIVTQNDKSDRNFDMSLLRDGQTSGVTPDSDKVTQNHENTIDVEMLKATQRIEDILNEISN